MPISMWEQQNNNTQLHMSKQQSQTTEHTNKTKSNETKACFGVFSAIWPEPRAHMGADFSRTSTTISIIYFTIPKDQLICFNPFKPSGVKWLHFKMSGP